MSTAQARPAPAKRPGRNRLLTREQVARAAFELVDAEGPVALTMNRLAGRLGVSPMTLYGYAESKDAIIAMLPPLLLAELPPVACAGPWPEVMEATFLDLYRRFVKHRHVTQLITDTAVFEGTMAHIIEDLLACLEAAGFDPDDAFTLQRTLATYTLGFAFFAIAEHTAATAAAATQSRTRWSEQLDPDDYPRLARASALLGAADDETQYLRGLRRILDRRAG
jgi:AcrR family transcriptional regulator